MQREENTYGFHFAISRSEKKKRTLLLQMVLLICYSHCKTTRLFDLMLLTKSKCEMFADINKISEIFLNLSVGYFF